MRKLLAILPVLCLLFHPSGTASAADKGLKNTPENRAALQEMLNEIKEEELEDADTPATNSEAEITMDMHRAKHPVLKPSFDENTGRRTVHDYYKTMLFLQSGLGSYVGLGIQLPVGQFFNFQADINTATITVDDRSLLSTDYFMFPVGKVSIGLGLKFNFSYDVVPWLTPYIGVVGSLAFPTELGTSAIGFGGDIGVQFNVLKKFAVYVETDLLCAVTGYVPVNVRLGGGIKLGL